MKILIFGLNSPALLAFRSFAIRRETNFTIVLKECCRDTVAAHP